MIVTATLFSADGAIQTLEYHKDLLPDEIDRPIIIEGKKYGFRTYQRDFYRDFEYREIPPTRTTYRAILNGLAADFHEKGDRATKLTLHVSLPVFKRIYKEYGGGDCPDDISYMQMETGSLPLFVRYAPEAEGSKEKLVLAPDLARLSLRELVDLKLSLDKEKKT